MMDDLCFLTYEYSIEAKLYKVNRNTKESFYRIN